jgi:hypothetical protein
VFEERAAIMEYVEGITRAEAEARVAHRQGFPDADGLLLAAAQAVAPPPSLPSSAAPVATTGTGWNVRI